MRETPALEGQLLAVAVADLQSRTTHQVVRGWAAQGEHLEEEVPEAAVQVQGVAEEVMLKNS